MKKHCLQTYLHDHLAGAALAIDLLKALQENHRQDGLCGFATELLAEILEDHEELKKLSSQIENHTAGFKEMLARLLEKISRLKFHRPSQGALGTFEALETLALGILGKEALWTALASVPDPRLADLDFPRLILRARQQHERVERKRMELAPLALRDVLAA
jgi:hypothetical protein